jgi:hypothetical protein
MINFIILNMTTTTTNMWNSNILDALINMNSSRANGTTSIAKQIEICLMYHSGGGGGGVVAVVDEQ